MYEARRSVARARRGIARTPSSAGVGWVSGEAERLLVKDVRSEVGAVGPDHGAELGIDGDLGEIRHVFERLDDIGPFGGAGARQGRADGPSAR